MTLKLMLTFYLSVYSQTQTGPQTPAAIPSDLSNLSANDLKAQFYSVPYPGPNDPQLPAGVKRCVIAGIRAYKVQPGYFQQSVNAAPVLCTAGFYCPGDTFQPFYCCEGYYCSTPDKIAICPENRYCPYGTVNPNNQNCWSLASCPLGTVKPFRYGMIIIIFVSLIIIGLGFSIKNRLDIQKAIRNRMLVEMAKQEKANKNITVTSTNQKSLDIEFDELEYKLPDGNVIMSNVSGFFKIGKMTAVMGPSGAGKSTLFSLLSGKIQKSRGKILLNGKTQDLSKYRKLVGYVPQDDIMHRELTVNNVLLHSANMRLPSNLSSAQKKKKVVQTIEFLGLGQVINTVVGDEETRGISGGQRKRVNIGMEIVADPSVLFLDEPTSGLDSSTALELCEILKRLAIKNKMTIAAVVHSPSPQSFAQFDDVLFLGKGGKMVYFGPTKGVRHYFRELGFECPRDVNPADFAMDVISGRKDSAYDKDFRPADLFDYWQSYQDGTPLNKIGGNTNKTLRRPMRDSSLISKVFSSFFTMSLDFVSWIYDVTSEFVAFGVSLIRTFTFMGDPVRNTPNPFTLYFLLLKRAFQQQFRSSKRFIFDSIIHFVAGLIVSVAVKDFAYLGKNPDEVCQFVAFQLQSYCRQPIDFLNQAGALMCVGIFFAGQATAAYTFGNEKVIYWRDTSAGMPTTAYFLAKFTADIPRIFIASFFYTLAYTVFLDYRSSFFSMMMVNICLYVVAFQFGYLISILFAKSSVGLIVAANALINGFLLAGATPDNADIVSKPEYAYVRWLWSWSAPRWGVEAYYILEASGREWQELKTGKWSHNYSPNNYTPAIINMFQIAALWAFVSFLALKLTNRRKQK